MSISPCFITKDPFHTMQTTEQKSPSGLTSVQKKETIDHSDCMEMSIRIGEGTWPDVTYTCQEPVKNDFQLKVASHTCSTFRFEINEKAGRGICFIYTFNKSGDYLIRVVEKKEKSVLPYLEIRHVNAVDLIEGRMFPLIRGLWDTTENDD